MKKTIIVGVMIILMSIVGLSLMANNTPPNIISPIEIVGVIIILISIVGLFFMENNIPPIERDIKRYIEENGNKKSSKVNRNK